MGIFFLILSVPAFWQHKAHAHVLLEIAAAFIILGVLAPSVLKPLQKVWMALALCLGWVMSRVILCVIFYAVMTPISLILRLSRKELLQRKWREKKDTFWTNHAINKPTQSYENQY
jgi:ABC-type uncharacterized transport system permease subunit